MRIDTGDRAKIPVSYAQMKEPRQRFRKFHEAWIGETADGAKKYEAIILAEIRKKT